MPSKGIPGQLSRRRFVAAGALGSAAFAIGCRSGTGGSLDFLSERQARALAVICDQIVPADDFPSASQAGVLDYIDRQLMRAYRRHRLAYGHGLEDAEAASRKRYGGELASLAQPQQLQVVSDLFEQNRSFFELVRDHTMEGYYGSPRHGGNRDAVSWRMLGLADPPVRGRAQYDLAKRPSL